jgi:hypothetical protein
MVDPHLLRIVLPACSALQKIGHRILPLLESWGVQMNEHCGTNPSVLFFTDGKMWRMS